MIARYRILQERIETEFAEVCRAAEKARQAYGEAQPTSPNATFYLDSVAMNLHGFYGGLERIFLWVARDLDGGPPSGRTWHRDLLDQMALQVPDIRPAVVYLPRSHRKRYTARKSQWGAASFVAALGETGP